MNVAHATWGWNLYFTGSHSGKLQVL